MKRFFTLFLCLSLLSPSVWAAEGERHSIALIDTGISTAVIDEKSVAEGKNYVREGYDTEDSLGHGTAVAELILEQAPNANLVPLVYCDEAYGKQIACNLETVAQMVRDAVDIYSCRIINISAATVADFKPLREAIAYAEEKGAVVIAAVGNGNRRKPEQIYYPAAYDTVIGVGALGINGDIASFSQRNSVSLVALGEKLSVTLPNGENTTVSGTSFACAYVTATASRLLEIQPNLTPPEVRSILFETATDFGEEGFDEKSGYGTLNPEVALARQTDFYKTATKAGGQHPQPTI